MRGFGSVLTLSALVLTSTFCVSAPALSAPELSVSVEPAKITVGDLFTVTVTAEIADGVEVDLPLDDADLGDAEVRYSERVVEVLPDGGQRIRVDYQATLWEVGEHSVLAPRATWRAPEGDPRDFERPAVTVAVRSVLPQGAEDIRPVRDPHEIPLQIGHYLLAALPPLLLVALIAGAILWLRRRRRDQEAAEAPIVALTPAEEALKALDELESEDLVGQAMLKEHYVELSQILRRYVERRWHLPALEETTGMLAESMAGSGRIDQEAAGKVTSVLHRADLAKFAKHRPEPAAARADIDQVREIVCVTQPGEEAREEIRPGRAMAS